jgi:hypothetical protein
MIVSFYVGKTSRPTQSDIFPVQEPWRGEIHKRQQHHHSREGESLRVCSHYKETIIAKPRRHMLVLL